MKEDIFVKNNIDPERCPHPPYEGAKDYFYISDVDDREYLETDA